MMMRRFLAVLRKEFLIEARAKELTTVMLTLAILLSVVLGFGVEQAFLDILVKERIFPLLIWVAFLFSGTLTLGKVHDYDVAEGAHEALLLSGVSAPTLYVGKVVVHSALLFLGQGLTLVLIAGMVGVPLAGRIAPLLILTGLVILAYVALTVIIAALVIGSRLKQVLLPLILFPLLMPLLFAALELTSSILASGEFPLHSAWLSVLLFLNLLYLAAGTSLYRFAVLD